MWSRSTEGKNANELIKQNLKRPQKVKNILCSNSFANIFGVLEMQSEFDKKDRFRNVHWLWRKFYKKNNVDLLI